MYRVERCSQEVRDGLLIWLLPTAAVMMLLGRTYWPVIALVESGVCLHLHGVVSVTHPVLQRTVGLQLMVEPPRPQLVCLEHFRRGLRFS